MKNPISYILSLFCFSVFVACVDESSSVGSKWVESSIRNVVTDTCTVELSTILADSITTSGDDICQIGRYRDQLRGSLQGSFFTEYNMPTGSLNDETTYMFDSITLSMYPSGDYLGDTLSTRHQIHLHRITEIVELIDNTYLYNTSSVQYEDTPLTSFSFTSRPKKGEKIEVRLPDELGKDFLDLMTSKSPFLDSQDRFRQYFQGIAFLPDDNSDCINGFLVNDSSMCLTMYYRKIAETATELTTTLTPSSTLKFNKAGQDFTGTPLESIESGTINAVKSSESDNLVYLQGLTGLYIKLEFPSLNNLQEHGDMVTIESATLYLYPVSQTYGDYIPLPETLTLYTANSNDVTDGIITDSTGETVQDGSLVKDDMENHDAYYRFNITDFLQSNLGTFGINRQKLMLMLPDEKFLTTMEGIILGDKNHPTNKVKLEIYYKIYNN